MVGNNPEALLAGKMSNKLEPVHRSHWNKKINAPLKEHFPGKDKYIRCHSNRISFATDVWKKTPDLEVIREFLGHKNRVSTTSYVRNNPLLLEQKLKETGITSSGQETHGPKKAGGTSTGCFTTRAKGKVKGKSQRQRTSLSTKLDSKY